MVDGVQNGEPAGGETAAEAAPAPKKSKAQLKAERRALQEAQRAAKADGGGGAKAKDKTQQQPQQQRQGKRPEPAVAAASDAPATSAAEQPALVDDDNVHPAFKSLVADCLNGSLLDSHDICYSMVDALIQFISTLDAKMSGTLCRDVDAALRPQISHATGGGGNALPAGCGTLVKQLKAHVHALAEQRHLTDEQVRESVAQWLCGFKRERLSLAVDAISQYAVDKLGRRRVLTYAWCPIVQRLLLDAHEADRRLSVAVVDMTPETPGKRLLSRLVEAGVPVTYALLSSLAYLMKDTDVVLIGCDSIAANGHALARLGACQVALAARAHNIPVLVACPTYKFSEKVWTRAGTAGSFAPTGARVRQQHHPHSPLCTQRQELVPVDLIAGVVTELRVLPASSAPAVLRVKQQITA